MMLASGSRQFADRRFPVELPKHYGEIGEALRLESDRNGGANPLCPHCGCHLRTTKAIEYGNIVIAGDGEVAFEDRPVALQRRLHDIVVALVRAEGRALTRSQLAFGLSDDTSDEAIVKAVERLRRHFRQLRPGFDQIETVRGFGAYRWRYGPWRADTYQAA